jgi:hypothetical protein
LANGAEWLMTEPIDRLQSLTLYFKNFELVSPYSSSKVRGRELDNCVTKHCFSALKTGQKKVNPREWEESRVDAKQDQTHESCFYIFGNLANCNNWGMITPLM